MPILLSTHRVCRALTTWLTPIAKDTQESRNILAFLRTRRDKGEDYTGHLLYVAVWKELPLNTAVCEADDEDVRCSDGLEFRGSLIRDFLHEAFRGRASVPEAGP